MGAFEEAHRLAAAFPKPNEALFEPNKHQNIVDGLIRIFDRARIDRLKQSGSPSELPLLVVGLPRSGTTLLEQILTRHPAIGTSGELTYWFTNEDALTTNLAGPKPDLAQAKRMADEYLKILSSIAPDKARMVDKRNTNFMSLGPLHALFPNARVIHCRRHPIDNCLSLYTTLFRGYAPGYTHTKENLAFYYRQYDRLMKHWISVLPADRVLEIEYEALVSDPERTIRALVEFCGVEWDERCLEHEQNQRLVLTPSLWQVRQPIYKTSVERWRRYEPWLGPLKDLMPAKS